jgi:hypothetical protein
MDPNIILQFQHREQYLLSLQKQLEKKEAELSEREELLNERYNEIILYEKNLLLLEDNLKLEKEISNSCTQEMSIYCEWGVFQKNNGGESRLGVSSLGKVFITETFTNLLEK